MIVSIMVLIWNVIPVFMTTLTLVSAHYSNSSSPRLQQLQRTFYETNGRTISSDNNSPESQTTSTDVLTTTASSVQNLTAIRLANEHFLLIRTQYRCRTPRPKLIKVKDFYDVPSKEYLPRCTVLHQCDDESGCCEVGTERCVAQTAETVELHFYVIHSDMSNSNTGGNSGRTEVLTFVNHTRCHCQEINYMPRTKPMPEHWQSRPVNEYKPISNFETTTERSVQSQTESDSDTPFRLSCRCPHPFIARISPIDERCICDCLERDYHCSRIKRGRHKLSALDARCVRAGDCTEPMCEFGGTYSKHEAMCQIPKHSTNAHKLRRHHHQHRHQKPVHWLQERD